MTRKAESLAGAWVLYILECRDGTFYTGVTNDIERRLRQHNAGNAARYTRGRGPVTLRYREACSGRSQALAREAAVKRLTRRGKQRLMNLTD
jgi:putative endonuclease